jgi:hypothetical protein
MTDESGCLGFDLSKQGTSRFFSIALLVVKDKKQVNSIVKKVFRSLSKIKIKRSNGILHAYYEDKPTRIKLLSAAAAKDIEIAIIRLDKRRLVLAGDTHLLYMGMMLRLINQLFMDGHLNASDTFELIASQVDTNKLHKENFVAVINESTATLNLEARLAKPAEEKGLQVIDFISWSYWQKYENGNAEYADIVADKVIA